MVCYFSLDIFIINKTLENKWLSYYSKIKHQKIKLKIVLVEKALLQSIKNNIIR